MNLLKLHIQYLLVVVFVTFIHSNLQAHQYFPFSVGNQWIYRNSNTGQKIELSLIRPLDFDQQLNNPIQGQRLNLPNLRQPPNNVNQRTRPNLPNQVQRPNIPKQVQKVVLPPKTILLETRLNQELIISRGIYIDSDSLNQVLLRSKSGNFIFGLNQPFLPSNLAPGKKWSATSQGIKRCNLETKWSVKSVETVRVKAGKFRSLKIAEENNFLNCGPQNLELENAIQSIWYAAKVGPIKIMFMDQQTYELTEFNSPLAVESSRHKLTTNWAKLKQQ